MKNLILSFTVLILISFSVNAQVSSTQTKKKPTAEEQRQLNERQKQAEKKNQTQNISKSQGQPDNPNAPVITFDKLVHDYGTLEQNGDGQSEFTFTNTGKEPLILSNVRSS